MSRRGRPDPVASARGTGRRGVAATHPCGGAAAGVPAPAALLPTCPSGPVEPDGTTRRKQRTGGYPLLCCTNAEATATSSRSPCPSRHRSTGTSASRSGCLSSGTTDQAVPVRLPLARVGRAVGRWPSVLDPSRFSSLAPRFSRTLPVTDSCRAGSSQAVSGVLPEPGITSMNSIRSYHFD